MAVRVHNDRELTLGDVFPYSCQCITADAYLCIFFGEEQYLHKIVYMSQHKFLAC